MNSIDLKISVYPNPVYDFLFIEQTGNKDMYVTIYNTLGKLILSRQVSGQKVKLNLETLTSGLYIIHVNQMNSSISKQIIKE